MLFDFWWLWKPNKTFKQFQSDFITMILFHSTPWPIFLSKKKTKMSWNDSLYIKLGWLLSSTWPWSSCDSQSIVHRCLGVPMTLWGHWRGQNRISFSWSVGICANGEKAVVGKTACALVWIKAEAWNYTTSHCILYHHPLTEKDMPVCLGISLMKQ